jgi:hypothetical protein
VPIRSADSFLGKADVFVGAAYHFAPEPASQTATPRPSTKFRRRIGDLRTDGDGRSAIEVARKSRDKVVPAGVSLLGLNPSDKVTGRAGQLCPGISDVDFLGDLKRDADRHARSEAFRRLQKRRGLDRQ